MPWTASLSSVRFVAPSGMISSPGATASELTIHLLSAGVISMVRTFSSFSFARKENGRPKGSTSARSWSIIRKEPSI